MKLPHFVKSYQKKTKRLIESQGTKAAMSASVGGDFEAVGKLEFAILLQHGLEADHTVVDVGCGSGRLAFQLAPYLKGRYIGIDVVRELYAYAQKICQRPDWSFYEAPGLTIPEADGSADFVCFFSVFTHLLHEESYKYLMEAARVIKPSGKIVISFLEFRIPSHWSIFAQVLGDENPDKVLNQFLSRDAIRCWIGHVGLEMEAIYDGDKPHIDIDETIRWEDGREMQGQGFLGQSVCVLTKR